MLIFKRSGCSKGYRFEVSKNTGGEKCSPFLTRTKKLRNELRRFDSNETAGLMS